MFRIYYELKNLRKYFRYRYLNRGLQIKYRDGYTAIYNEQRLIEILGSLKEFKSLQKDFEPARMGIVEQIISYAQATLEDI